jgi:predicted nuclease of restriction endonuclease-like (RecB) superfamily
MTVSSDLLSADHYQQLLEDLKQRIRQAQVKAALAVNRELILLYWQLGKEILQRQDDEGWGRKVIDRLSADLKREFPDVKGFSPRNLKYMRAFAAAYPDITIVQQAAAQIPWTHNCVLLDKVKDPSDRLWYIEQVQQHGWSRNVMVLHIEGQSTPPPKTAITNFAQTLPPPDSDLAMQLIKDPYNFDFLTLSQEVKEQELEKGLVNHIRDFLLELGVGFAFMGSQYPIKVDGKAYALDLLFYHTHLHAYVVIELHLGEFEPEFSGKMNFYVSAVDAYLKREGDNRTIGIILCRDKQKTTVEFALQNLEKPISVSTYRLSNRLPESMQDALPSPERLQQEMDMAASDLAGSLNRVADRSTPH